MPEYEVIVKSIGQAGLAAGHPSASQALASRCSRPASQVGGSCPRGPLRRPELAAEAISADDRALTPRETDVLELAAGGTPVEEIAVRTHLSPGTFRNHLSAAAAKLEASSRHVAVDVARGHGWISG
jgi:DNA-binding NarL/FixJ family response regulator